MDDFAVLACLAYDLRAPSDELAGFSQRLKQFHWVESILEVSGTYDLIIQCRFDSFAHYSDEIAAIRPLISRVATRLDVNFISSRTECRSQADGRALWLPCEGGRKRIEVSLIDKVLAEGDYMRIHVGTWSYLVHLTMGRLAEQLSGPDFVRLRRSCLVRVGFIDRLTHEGRRWTARFKDGTSVPIAQTSVNQVIRLIAGESSTPRRSSSKEGRSDAARPVSIETPLKVPS